MAYKDVNEKAIGFAESGIRERKGNIYLKRKKMEEHQANADRLRAELQQEEEILQGMQAEVDQWQQEKVSLKELIEALKKSEHNFEMLSDEEFESRRKQIRWAIADVLGHYTFIVDGRVPDIQGGF